MPKQAASELKLSPAAHAKIISAVIWASGRDLYDFPISTSRLQDKIYRKLAASLDLEPQDEGLQSGVRPGRRVQQKRGPKLDMCHHRT